MIENIKKIINLMKEEGIDEIEFRRFFTTIRVMRNRFEGGHSHDRSRGEELLDESEDINTGKQSVEKGSDRSSMEVEKGKIFDNRSKIKEISSPMVGTFYRRPGPEAEPYTEEGETIEIGETLCIIESMKLMNEIESEIGGIVREILVEDSQPVEYGQPLFLIETA